MRVPPAAIMRLSEALEQELPEGRVTFRQLYVICEHVLDALLDDPDARSDLVAELDRRAPAHTVS